MEQNYVSQDVFIAIEKFVFFAALRFFLLSLRRVKKAPRTLEKRESRWVRGEEESPLVLSRPLSETHSARRRRVNTRVRRPTASAFDGARERTLAAVAQPVERVLGKDEVKGPIPFSSSFVGRSGTSAVGSSVRPVYSSNRPA